MNPSSSGGALSGGKSKSGKVKRAAACAIESLERRQLLSAVLTTYPIPNSDSNTWEDYGGHIVAGADGNFWFTDEGNDAIGRVTPAGAVTEFKLPIHNDSSGSPESSSPYAIVAGSDGALWFTENGANRIGRITTSGSISEYTIPTDNTNPTDMVLGPDGNLWFGEWGGNAIGKITPSGKITEYSLGSLSVQYQDALTVGPDGNLDFAAVDSAEHGCLGTITTAGQITVKPLDFIPRSMVTFDGSLWATDVLNIVRIGADGTTTTYSLPDKTYNPPETLEVGNDGNLYVTMLGTTSFAKITSSGTITEYPLPNDSAGNPVRMEDLVEAPDGRFWYIDDLWPQVGVVDLTNALLAQHGGASVTAGLPQAAMVGSFLDLAGVSSASDYTAKLTLSDGTVLDGVITANDSGGFDVSVTNNWNIGFTDATLTIIDTRNTSRTATASSYIFAAAPSAVGTEVSIKATVGQMFNGLVATFTNVALDQLSAYSATIAWGDGHTTQGTLTANSSGGIDVTGSNDYAESGTFSVNVTLMPYKLDNTGPGLPTSAGSAVGFSSTIGNVFAGQDGVFGLDPRIGKTVTPPPAWDGSGEPAFVTDSATVSDGVMHGTAFTVQASSTTTFTGDVASFTLTKPSADLSHYHATVEYNDPGMQWWFTASNTPTVGTISAQGNGGFTVSTSTKFNSSGLYRFVVQITDDHLGTGNSAIVGVAYGQIVVDNPTKWLPAYYSQVGAASGGTAVAAPGNSTAPDPTNPALGEQVKVSPVSLKTATGKKFNGVVGTLSGVTSDISSLQGTINWGDGTTSAATFVKQKNGTIAAKGMHVYSNGGEQAVSIDVTQSLDGQGSALTAMPLLLPEIRSAASVAGVKYHYVTTGGIAITASAGLAFTGNVASFATTSTDSNVTRNTVIWWGDGTHSTGTVVSGDSAVTVSGSHTYKRIGTYKVRVQVLQGSAKGSHVKVAGLLAMIQSSATVS